MLQVQARTLEQLGSTCPYSLLAFLGTNNELALAKAALIRLGLAGTARQEVVKQISSDADPRKKNKATPNSRCPRVNVAFGLSDFFSGRKLQKPAITLQHCWGTERRLKIISRGSLNDWGKLRAVQKSHVCFHHMFPF